MAQEDILRECIVEQAPTTTDDGPALAGQVVSKSDTWSKIIEVLVIELTGGNHISNSRVEAVEQIVLLADYAEVVPADAIVQSETIGPAEAVLQVEGVAIFKGMPLAVARCYFAATGKTFEESREVSKTQPSTKCVVLN